MAEGEREMGEGDSRRRGQLEEKMERRGRDERERERKKKRERDRKCIGEGER